MEYVDREKGSPLGDGAADSGAARVHRPAQERLRKSLPDRLAARLGLEIREEWIEPFRRPGNGVGGFAGIYR